MMLKDEKAETMCLLKWDECRPLIIFCAEKKPSYKMLGRPFTTKIESDNIKIWECLLQNDDFFQDQKDIESGNTNSGEITSSFKVRLDWVRQDRDRDDNIRKECFQQ